MISDSETLQFATALRKPIRDWVLEGFEPRYDQLSESFDKNARWQAVKDTGTELWLDTGDLKGIEKSWTREFTALTTNNTLLNAEVQRGQYDSYVKKTAAHIRKLHPSIPQNLLVLEIAFVLNAYHGLRLVENFDALVSVEEHTDLAHNIDLAVLYGQRFAEICPQRFIVKLPMTPQGLLAMRKLRQDNVPVNFTLGFSARHNYVAARLGDPNYVNVFLGRLNAFTSDSKLGSGDGVGEKATAASQEAITALRRAKLAKSRQIAASMRGPEQVWTLAGTDVMTVPLKVAEAYAESSEEPPKRRGPTSSAIEPELDAAEAKRLRYDTLWEVSGDLQKAMDALTADKVEAMKGEDLVRYFEQEGIRDLFPEYSPGEIDIIREDGKIPKLERWRRRVENGTSSIDSLLNVSGLYSFAEDQRALDDRIRGLLH